MRSTRRQLASELVLLAAWAVVTFLAAAQLDLFELFHAWSRQHEELNVDELGAVSVVVMLGLGLFGWRRYRDTQAEARRAQEARDTLLGTRDRYQSLFTHNPHGVYSLDLSGNFVSVNNAAQDLSGYDESQLLGKNFVELLAPGHLEDTMDLFVLALSGTAGTLDIAIVRADGEEVDLTIQASPIVVRDQVVGVYGVAEDITAEREMARDLQRTQAAVEATLDGVLIGDEDHRIVYANEASARLHGYDAAERCSANPSRTSSTARTPTSSPPPSWGWSARPVAGPGSWSGHAETRRPSPRRRPSRCWRTADWWPSDVTSPRGSRRRKRCARARRGIAPCSPTSAALLRDRPGRQRHLPQRRLGRHRRTPSRGGSGHEVRPVRRPRRRRDAARARAAGPAHGGHGPRLRLAPHHTGRGTSPDLHLRRRREWRDRRDPRVPWVDARRDGSARDPTGAQPQRGAAPAARPRHP